MNYQHSFVLANLCVRVCFGRIAFCRKLVAGAGFEPVRLTEYEPVEPPLLHSRIIKILEAKARFELASFCLQDRRSFVR